MKSLNSIERKINDCKYTDINNIDLDEIDNIDDITINEELSSEDRIKQFLIDFKNPYCYKIDEFIVKLSFSENNINADKCVLNAMKHIIYK